MCIYVKCLSNIKIKHELNGVANMHVTYTHVYACIHVHTHTHRYTHVYTLETMWHTPTNF